MTELSYLQAAGEGLLAFSLLGLAALLLVLYSQSESRQGIAPTMLLLLGVGLGVAGFAHLADVIGFWSPVTGITAVLNIVAGIISLVALVLVWRLLPRLRGGFDRKLEAEIAAHSQTRQALTDAESELEVRVAAHQHELERLKQRFEIALRNSPIGVFTQDADMRFTWVHNPPPGLSSKNLLGRRDEEVLPPSVAEPIIAAKKKAMATKEPQELETSYEAGGRQRALYILIEPMLDKEEKPTGTISVVVDISQRRAQEMQLRLLLRELTHRSKNLLAVINAIARQTAARTCSVDEFLENFNARLVAIGTAHDLLVADDWRGASLKNLVKTQLYTHLRPREDQIEVEGEDVMLKPDAVQNVGLALHELFMNAQKYGALSTEKGHVNVHWGQQDGHGVRLVWEERGGPQVPRPDCVGFGRIMIENVVGKALTGAVDLTFDPDGVRCKIDIPPSQLIPD
ncbi:HWE histidine kinase domain-containing protein [Methyloligella solikamskensis]|uniref:Blue-light-activated histidine kinase n=1 Tax=Methyloligella solikamskensis TaxID=1177756 RepID=A0ABW3JDM6_9HYPH